VKAKDYQTLTLCAFIHNRGLFDLLSSELSSEFFTEPELYAVYETMIAKGAQFTVPELGVAVQGQGGLALIKDIGNSYKRYGVDKDFSENDTRKYAQAVDRMGRLHNIRVLLKAASEDLDEDKLGDEEKDEELVAGLINNLVGTQYQRESQKGFQPFDQYLGQFQERLTNILAGNPAEDRLESGFTSFDGATGGGYPVGLTVLGGMPGSGKTQWAWQSVINIASRIRDNEEVGICAVNSVEMTGAALASRSVLASAGIDSVALRLGKYNDDEAAIKSINRELRRQKGLPILIDESDYLTSNMISARVSGLKARFKNVVIVVTDFAEIVSDPGESQELRVAKVFVSAKALGKRLKCPVMLLTQLNRAVELTNTRVPSMRSIRYSGMAEAIADMIVLIYNPQYYITAGVKLTTHPQMPPVDGRAYLIVGKNREGAVGFLPMGWAPTFARWSDLGVKTLDSYQEV